VASDTLAGSAGFSSIVLALWALSNLVANLCVLITPSKGFAELSRVVCVALTLKTALRSDAVSV
jgi:hypothetical protein